MKIYEGNSKEWDFGTISLIGIPFCLVRQCDENSHDLWKALIEKNEASDEKQESLNEVTNRWNNCNIKNKSLDTYIWFNELYNINLKFKRIKAKYDKYEDELKSNIFGVLPE